MIKNKTNYVADGIVQFADALILQHHADECAVYERLVALCQAKVDRLVGIDPQRNR